MASLVIAALLVTAALADAHDFWLVPNPFQVAPGGTMEVLGQTSSSFPTSESAVALDRIADARVLGATGAERIADLSHRGTSLLLRHRPRTAGQRVVAVAVHPRSVRESAAGFRRYLELEGAPDALARVDREGLLQGRDSVTRRYAKYAKALVEVGSGGPRSFGRAADHPLEFIPEGDPAALRIGDTLAVRLMYRGRPLPGIRVHAGVVPASDARPQLAASANPDVHLVTDGDGRVRLPIAKTGLWNIRTIHVVQADPGSGADWDTHWATLVFGMTGQQRPAAAGAPSTASGDSAAVARVVRGYHDAMARGDSAAALALLAPHAVILESGGRETREEYRSHHLPADIAFARAVPSQRSPVHVTVRGDVAWAVSTSTAQGEFQGRQVHSSGAELMVLERTPAGWRIAAIHWSSGRR